MGEMADYLINGDDCQHCGEYLGQGDGYPRLCKSCSKNEDHENTVSAQELIERGIGIIRTAAIILEENDKIKKSKGLYNMCDQLSKFGDSLK